MLNHPDTQQTYIKFRTNDSKSSTTDQRFISYDLRMMKKSFISDYDIRLERWLRAMDLYDREITIHTLRVTALSLEMGRFMGLSNDELVYIQYGTLLHDIGKLGIPNSIIHKPGKLTAYEYRVVQQHPIYANEWIAKGEDYEPAKVIPLFHHEKWDGSGYPYGLKGDEIPLLARIVAVVDVWDAITSDRPYRKAMCNDRAIHLIKTEAGHHFDPTAVDAFFQLGLYRAERIPSTL
jgi:HD-GYP domain-containing protein (c-di-GMP phosphodiesterase class II)